MVINLGANGLEYEPGSLEKILQAVCHDRKNMGESLLHAFLANATIKPPAKCPYRFASPAPKDFP
jgi:hypothetical protein